MKFVLGIVVLSAVIFFHELGHFLLAKASHIVVNEFAFGMGPKILSFTKGETTYAWRILPFGGSCTMMGEDEEEEAIDGCFNKAPVWNRIAVVAAGPVFNFLMAFVVSVIVIGFMGVDPARVVEVDENSPVAEAGLQEGDLITSYEGNGIANARELYTDIELDGVPLKDIHMTVKRDGKKISIDYDPVVTTRYMMGYYHSQEEGAKPEILELMKGYPMETAGFQAGDVITSINGVKVSSQEELQGYLDDHPLDGSPVKMTVDRAGQEIAGEFTPISDTSAALGFSFNLMREKKSVFGTLRAAFGEMKYWIHVTVKSLATLITGQYSVKDMSGPVGVVTAMGDTYDEVKSEGALIIIMTFLNFAILLSANLGIMNLLPIPALDGGRLVFLIIEAILGRPLNRKLENYVHIVGLMLLMLLMVFIMYNDIAKLFVH
ncbi:MAG: RIP metalloprotease RseP [Lachnospiraceae bacterium]|nr:RIP metalloprotease RseP [Lachnospiraceae bacterium]